MSALGLDVHGKDPVSDEEQSSDEESEVSDAGSEAMAGRRARIRRVEDEDDDDNTDQPDELEPWVEPEEKAREGLWATNGGSACDENDTSGLVNQTAGANANVNAGGPVAVPSTSQMQTDGTEAITQTSKPSRSKGDKTKGERKDKKDKKEGPSRPKQPKPKAPKPKPAEEKDEADVTNVDEGDAKSKVKRPGGYVNHERVKTGGSERAKLTEEELATRMERIRLQNEKIKEKRQKAIDDEEEFNKISADDIDVRQRKERQARLQTEVDRERQKVAQRKLAQLQNRAWDAGKKGPAEQGSAPRADKNSFWGMLKVEPNGDIKPGPEGEAEGAAETTSPGGVERGRGRGRGFRGGDRGSGRGRGEGGRGRGRGGPSRASTSVSQGNNPTSNESNAKPSADVLTATPTE